ncbi:PIN domain-containing protein [Bacillus sp. FJAT-27251]|uniref:PIN domain-containing protein n=1 Tax=Bacillus sp. FJAT-27251 TaxID=1684142 RepID=UPI0006A77636|nr:PIN domain-containing protein [Bacillus sp. FJAT-27251]
MKYLALDTNIYLDMVVSRNKSHKSESYNQMQKLLDYGEIRLLVPAVIITEVKRHLDQEIEKIYEELKRIKKSVEGLYWINNVEEMRAFTTSIPAVKTGIKELHSLFEANKNQYISDAHALFNKLFEHKNVIILEETQNILHRADKRKLHKKRPFHYNEPDKDSIADAVIIETLINIKDYNNLINFTPDDQLFFISRNTADFSDKQQNTALHSDIKESLGLSELTEQFNYRIHFTKTLLEDFKDETEHAGFLEELEQERARELYGELEYEEIARNREAGGLIPLSANWEEIISERPEIYEMMKFLNECKENLLSNFAGFSEDYFEAIETIRGLDLGEAQSLINSFNNIEAGTLNLNGNLEEMQDEILGLFTDRINLNPEDFDSEEMWKCEEVFDFTEDLLEFKDFDNQNFRVYVVGELNPEDGGSDTIQIKLVDNIRNNSDSSYGVIDVVYGYLNFDEDGNPSDGLSDEFNIHLENILEACEEIYNQINNQIEEEKTTLDYLKNSMGL